MYIYMVAGLMLLVDLRAVDLGLNSKSHTQNPPTPYTPHPPPQALNPGGPAWGGFRCWPGWTPAGTYMYTMCVCVCVSE